jgi:hypothetical protein
MPGKIKNPNIYGLGFISEVLAGCGKRPIDYFLILLFVKGPLPHQKKYNIV